MTTFYRVHWDDCPPLTPDNAWSALWGADRSPDGSQTECRTCDTTGTLDGETCTDCNGQGWEDCVPGYSSAATPEQLIAYFTRSGMEPTATDTVIIFDGQQVDTGFDGEPTTVPDTIIETLTWAEFTARHQEAA